MRVFLSYASENRDLASRLALGLRNLGMETFFDRDALPAGESFDDRIAAAIAHSHLFVFLISGEAVTKGAYTLTELGLAQSRWPRPSGAVLPVFIEPVAVEHLPPYLRSVSILDPSGEPVGDTLNAVAALAKRWRHRRRVRVAAGFAAVLLAAVSLWAVVVKGPATIGEHVSRAFHPPEVASVLVSPGATTANRNDADFEVTLRNPSPDAVTTVSIEPEADQAEVSFGSSSEAFFAINPGDQRTLAVRSTLRMRSEVATFRWRMCWTYVPTEDWYAQGMQRQSGASAELAIFIERHKAQACDTWRPWASDR